MSFESNHSHPIEEHASQLAKTYLDKHSFPYDRISVKLDFTFMSKPSNHKIKVEPDQVNHRLAGEVVIQYNSLFLLQRPKEFLVEIIPHEVAHVLNALKGLNKGQELKEHGEEWGAILVGLQPKATPRSSGPGPIFDERPMKLIKGGVVGMCECPGLAGLSVVSHRQKRTLHAANFICNDCKSAIKPINEKEMPYPIKEQIEYVKSEMNIR